VETAELAELARDSGRADTGSSGETVVARIDPASQIAEGQDAELWVDVRSIHVFDPESGRNLTLGDSGPAAPAAGSVTESAAAAQAGPGPAGTGPGSAAGTGTDSAATPPR
jgi:hypothetical protein